MGPFLSNEGAVERRGALASAATAGRRRALVHASRLGDISPMHTEVPRLGSVVVPAGPVAVNPAAAVPIRGVTLVVDRLRRDDVARRRIVRGVGVDLAVAA